MNSVKIKRLNLYSIEAIKNIREALETKISIAFLDETTKKFKKTLAEFNDFIREIEDEEREFEENYNSYIEQ